jgi:hypothetical protein
MNEAAYSLIRERAPDELALYVKTRDRYFADPTSFVTPAAPVDRPLGMGAVDMLRNFSVTVFPLLSPILLALVTAVAAALQQEVSDQVVAEVRKLFAKPEPIFTQAQLATIDAEVSAVVKAQQQRLNLDPAQSQAVRDAIIARLALAKKS